jgi:hypothetical protein
MCRRRSKEIGEWAFSAVNSLGINRCYKFEVACVRQRWTAVWKFGTEVSDIES